MLLVGLFDANSARTTTKRDFFYDALQGPFAACRGWRTEGEGQDELTIGMLWEDGNREEF